MLPLAAGAGLGLGGLALSPITVLIAAPGRDKDCAGGDIGLIPPPLLQTAGSNMKQPAAARFLPALFHFLCLRANHSSLRLSRAGALRPR